MATNFQQIATNITLKSIHFYNTVVRASVLSLEIEDKVIETDIILKELRIAQLCSKNEQTVAAVERDFFSGNLKLKLHNFFVISSSEREHTPKDPFFMVMIRAKLVPITLLQGLDFLQNTVFFFSFFFSFFFTKFRSRQNLLGQ